MDLHRQQYPPQQHNLWVSVANLPVPSSFPLAPWETRHCQELALREAFCSSYSNTQHVVRKSENRQTVLDSQALNSSASQVIESAFELTSIREADLVNRCLYALQGIPIAVKKLQALAKLFGCQVADRSSHRLPSLWKRSSSTKALGKFLFAIVQAGWVRCQLEDFVNFFLNSKSQGAYVSQLQSEYQADSRQGKNKKKKKKGRQKVNGSIEEDLSLSPPYSLVNQAFSKAVKSILQGHLAALNTLTDSVLHRRSENGSHSVAGTCDQDYAGAVVGLPVCDMTLLELDLHTKVLRIQLQALASICLHKRSAETKGSPRRVENEVLPEDREVSNFDNCFDSDAIDFTSFPRGADLLTLLYRQLQEADNVHTELLRYLFSCACQPYLVFVHSWLYRATLTDPYKEFVVHEANTAANLGSESQAKVAVSTPCFLEGVCTALIRSGQQLQVLLKLVDGGVSHYACSTGIGFSNGFRMLESALKDWTEIANESSVFFPSLIFNKKMLDKLVFERKQKRLDLMKKFDLLFSEHPLQTDDNALQAESNILHQPDTSMLLDTDVAALEYVDDTRSSRSPILHGSPTEVESQDCIVTACEPISDNRSHLIFPEESFGLKTEEAKEDHDVSNPDLESRSHLTELEHTTGIEAGDNELSSLKTNMGSNHRKRWNKPNEVIILHGEQDEDLSCEVLPAEANSNFHEIMQYVCDLEAGTLHSKPAQGENYEFHMSDIAKSFPYNLPALTETNLQSKEYIYKVSNPLSRTTILPEGLGRGTSSIFFSNICLDKVGPEIFGLPCMHKLARHHKSLNIPQSDGYKKNEANFDAVSQKFWNFEDCLCEGPSSMKILPSLLFTRAPGAVERMSLEDSTVYMPCSEARSEMGHTEADVQYESEPRAATLLEMLEEEKKLEVLYHNPQNSKCTAVCMGGETWQSYLRLRSCEDTERLSIFETDQESSEVPLEIIVEKCIIQEVLSQYQCVSHFTVRLLHQVFGLPGHLAALRRYFFMERGDWADIFTSALYRNRWHPMGNLQRQIEMQILLEASVQNSSCQEDEYAERLHVCVGGEREDFRFDAYDFGDAYLNKTPLSAFSFITLGYRLEWPVNLIITLESLKLYNLIFHFLICVKVAAHAVGNIWRFLKDLLQELWKHGTSEKRDDLNTLILFRQQMDHFVTTLQGHLETQLLHNVWQKFLQALHHEGKDLLDLERIHGLYLQDALHVCFLSEGTKPVKNLIAIIMQCLLDLNACLNLFGKQENGKATLDIDRVRSVILESKQCFDSSIQQLLLISLNRRNDSALSQFWTRLDFNGFFGTLCSQYS